MIQLRLQDFLVLHYFGEIALLSDKPRQATVTADGTLKCLTLNRKTFGPCNGTSSRYPTQKYELSANLVPPLDM